MASGNKRISELTAATTVNDIDLMEVVQADPITGLLVNKKATISQAFTGTVYHNTLPDLEKAGALVNWGHVDDQSQSIVGDKTFVGTINNSTLNNSELVMTDASKNLISTTVLPNGTTATTQISSDNTDKIATDAFVHSVIPTLAVIPNTLYVNKSYTGIIQNGGIATPFVSIMQALNVIPAPISGDDADLKTIYKIYVYSGQYDEDVTIPPAITPRIIHLIAYGPVYLGLSTGNNFDTPTVARNVTYELSRPAAFVSPVRPTFAMLTSNPLNNDTSNTAFYKTSSWRVSGDFYLGDVSIGGATVRSQVILQNLILDGSMGFSVSSLDETLCNMFLYGCNFDSGVINFPYVAPSIYGYVSLIVAERTYFGAKITFSSLGRLDFCTSFGGFEINDFLFTDGTNYNLITNSFFDGSALFVEPTATNKNLYIDPMTRLQSGDVTAFSTNIVWVDHVLLAASGITYGHISDQAQTIYGDKTFDGATACTGTLTCNSVVTAISCGNAPIQAHPYGINVGGPAVLGGTSFQSYSFVAEQNIDFSGPYATVATLGVRFELVGFKVCMAIATVLSKTGDSSTAAITATIPAGLSELYPVTVDVRQSVLVKIGSTYQWAILKVTTAGAISITDAQDTAFSPGTSSVDVYPATIWWSLQ